MKLLLFSLLLLARNVLAADYLIPCSEKEPHAVEVKVEYDIRYLSKGSFTEYFRKSPKDEHSIRSLGSIGCGFGSSIYTSASISTENQGFKVSLELEQTGKHTGTFQKVFVIPWSTTDFHISDTKGTISAIVTWNKAQQDAAANP